MFVLTYRRGRCGSARFAREAEERPAVGGDGTRIDGPGVQLIPLWPPAAANNDAQQPTPLAEAAAEEEDERLSCSLPSFQRRASTATFLPALDLSAVVSAALFEGFEIDGERERDEERERESPHTTVEGAGGGGKQGKRKQTKQKKSILIKPERKQCEQINTYEASRLNM